MEKLLEFWVMPYARLDSAYGQYLNWTMHPVRITVEYEPEPELEPAEENENHS